MTYSHLRSIVKSNKQQIAIGAPSDSFFVETNVVKPYVPPTFSKVDFPTENPSILLVSAMGASGKTTTARSLSFDTDLPVLDLAKNEGVGDRTLTGTITDSYPVGKIGDVLSGIQRGTCGVIIDGIDEAQSKTTEESFEAFLNDIIRRSSGGGATSIIILGRGQAILDVWCYLGDAKADVGLLKIDPFNIEQAKEYIDHQARCEADDPQRKNYEDARDGVLDTLNKAFAGSANSIDHEFQSFVGYPPVLDAIGTLLRTERNPFRIRQRVLRDEYVGDVAAELLVRICDYLLDREHDEKAVPNFIETMVRGLPGEAELRPLLYNNEEQCARILASALSRPFQHNIFWGDEITDSQRIELDGEYSGAAERWSAVHPFFEEDKNVIRNPVFASVAIMYCMLSDSPEYRKLAQDYVSIHSPTYHLLTIMKHVARGRKVGVRMFNMLIQSSSDLLSLDAEIEVEVIGQSWQENDLDSTNEVDLSITVRRRDRETVYSFIGTIVDGDQLTIGPYIMNATMTSPIPVHLVHTSRVTAIGECYVSAPFARIDTPELSVRALPVKPGTASSNANLILDVERAEGYAKEVIGDVTIQCDTHDLHYPLASRVKERALDTGLDSEDYRIKFLRLKRILLEFAARGQSELARYRHKIDSDRVLSSDVNGAGKLVLSKLIEAGVIKSDGEFYRLDRARFSEVLGVSREQLRLGESSNQLREFIQDIH